eukprot:Awhi_evm1s14254
MPNLLLIVIVCCTAEILGHSLLIRDEQENSWQVPQLSDDDSFRVPSFNWYSKIRFFGILFKVQQGHNDERLWMCQPKEEGQLKNVSFYTQPCDSLTDDEARNLTPATTDDGLIICVAECSARSCHAEMSLNLIGGKGKDEPLGVYFQKLPFFPPELSPFPEQAPSIVVGSDDYLLARGFYSGSGVRYQQLDNLSIEECSERCVDSQTPCYHFTYSNETCQLHYNNRPNTANADKDDIWYYNTDIDLPGFVFRTENLIHTKAIEVNRPSQHADFKYGRKMCVEDCFSKNCTKFTYRSDGFCSVVDLDGQLTESFKYNSTFSAVTKDEQEDSNEKWISYVYAVDDLTCGGTHQAYGFFSGDWDEAYNSCTPFLNKYDGCADCGLEYQFRTLYPHFEIHGSFPCSVGLQCLYLFGDFRTKGCSIPSSTMENQTVYRTTSPTFWEVDSTSDNGRDNKCFLFDCGNRYCVEEDDIHVLKCTKSLGVICESQNLTLNPKRIDKMVGYEAD